MSASEAVILEIFLQRPQAHTGIDEMPPFS
jgi:hypothetical protein